jgi:hypothetical protein
MNITLPITLVLGTIAAPIAAQDRAKASAEWKEGTVAINYGSPAWRPAFADAMKTQATWRLGNNDPTRIELTCGLATDDGCIPAGEYGLAMAKNDQGKWDLVIYASDGQYSKGMKAWGISAAASPAGASSAKNLVLELSDSKQLAVRFGPHTNVYQLRPIEMLDAAKMEFAGTATKIEIMAVPIDGPLEDANVGKSSIQVDGTTIAWAMKLTIAGNGAKLAFENGRAAAIAAEIEGAKSTIERVKSMLADATDEQKQQIEAFLESNQDTIKKLEREKQLLPAFKASHTVSGTVADTEKNAKTLTFDAERFRGGVTLTFGAGDKVATFRVLPSEFRQQQQRRR